MEKKDYRKTETICTNGYRYIIVEVENRAPCEKRRIYPQPCFMGHKGMGLKKIIKTRPYHKKQAL